MLGESSKWGYRVVAALLTDKEVGWDGALLGCVGLALVEPLVGGCTAVMLQCASQDIQRAVASAAGACWWTCSIDPVEDGDSPVGI